MSVINQVLNQLEQRGAHSTAEQPMVRAVLHTKRDFVMPLLAFGLALIAVIAAWQWMSPRNQAVMAGSIAPRADTSPDPDALGKSSAQQKSAPTTVTPASGVLAGDKPAESPAPASRLSFELSSVPLPSSLRPFDQAQGRLRSGQALGGGSPAVKPVHATPTNNVNAKVAARTPASAVPMKQVSSAQQADAEFSRAAGLMQLGRIADAIAGYEAALRLDAEHDAARQALVALLLEGKRNADAEQVLLEGLDSKPKNTGLTMLLARLQVERGALEQATATLEKSLPFADTQTDYRAFLAALLQRQNRNAEAIKHYRIVLQHAPGNGVWLMGYGISLQAVQRNAEAKDVFQRALDTQTLSPELQAFVQQKLKGL